jgi:hypothetical protein
MAARLVELPRPARSGSGSAAVVLTVLLEHQAGAVLDTVFRGAEDLRQAGIELFQDIDGHHSSGMSAHYCRNPVDVLSSETLIGWCETDRAIRYPLLASIVTIAHVLPMSDREDWTEHATMLLRHAPDPDAVLKIFIERLVPAIPDLTRTWPKQQNVALLHRLETALPSAQAASLREARLRLTGQVAAKYALEAQARETDQRDEGFE